MRIVIRALPMFLVSLGFGQTDVLTQHNDNARTGWVATETKLTPQNVQPGSFRLLYTLPVDGQVYAQPLVVSNYMLLDSAKQKGIERDLLIVGTAHNTLYCFDSRKGPSAPIWTAKLGKSVPNNDVNCDDMRPEIGIVSTPVIDRESRTIWVVAKSKVPVISGGARYANKLFALSLDTGKNKANSPIEIEGGVPGTSIDSQNGTVYFDPFRQMNRPGLLLNDGKVFVAFGGHCDNGPFHGWVFAFDSITLVQKGIYCTTPDGDLSAGIPSGAGGIWMSGQGLVCDESGDIYFSTGNGAFSSDNSGRQTGNSFVRLNPGPDGFKLVTFFTPKNTVSMNERDRDVGSSGIFVVPGTNLAFGSGKDRDVYVMDKSNMGGFSASDNNVLQTWLGTFDGSYTSPVYWESVQWGKVVYTGGKEDFILGHRVNSGVIQPTVFTASTVKGKWPGSAMSISSNGSNNAIVWSLSRIGNDGILRAFDANDLSHLLWDSDLVPGDAVGLYAKFCPPTVANGKVYVPTFSKRVNVYGLPMGLSR